MHSQANRESDDTITSRKVAAVEIAALAKTIDNSGLLCQSTVPRDGYVVHDLGRFTVEVTSAGYAKSLYIDECHTLRDAWAMNEVIDRLTSWKAILGERIKWGPYGTATMEGSCN